MRALNNPKCLTFNFSIMDEKILTVSAPNDTATAMAMMNNNPWMYLVMLALFGGGGFGFNRGAENGALDIETQNKLNSLQSQINDNNNQWAREAIQGNGFAISQLAQNLNMDFNAIQGAVNSVNAAIGQLGYQNGMGFAGVSNAINLGNLNIIQQLKDCCCATQKQILEHGYQGRIETITQTNDLMAGLRAESGVTRTEIASFRQAWESSRYQDVVAEKTRLQTELDLLRQGQATAALFAPLQAEVRKIDYEVRQILDTYRLQPVTTTTTGA